MKVTDDIETTERGELTILVLSNQRIWTPVCRMGPYSGSYSCLWRVTNLSVILKSSRSHCPEINPNKSKVPQFGKTQLRYLHTNAIKIMLNSIFLQLTQSAKNLGLIIDTHIRFSEIFEVLKKTFANLNLIYIMDRVCWKYMLIHNC